MKQYVITGMVTITFVAAITAFVSCKKETPSPAMIQRESTPVLPETPYEYGSKHGVKDELATLGRVLFYDKQLSVNNAVSCGSCHKQEFAFADNVRFNKGFNGVALTRNSPSIQGMRGFILNFNSSSLWNPTRESQAPVLLFWDGRQKNMADMVLNPVLNHNEMNMPDMESLVKRISSIGYYPDLFYKAYGSTKITPERIAYALEGFVSCLNTQRTPTRTVVEEIRLLPDGSFPPGASQEKIGEFLFHHKYNCARCHDGNPFNTGTGGYGSVSDPSFMFNIGLDETTEDKGLGRQTGLQGDMGVFKVPTLRNISRTAPYMHDGRFATLGEVLDHYSHNIKANINLTSLFRSADGTPAKLNISPAEKVALIAFLNSLVDEDFLTSPMYSDPFSK